MNTGMRVIGPHATRVWPTDPLHQIPENRKPPVDAGNSIEGGTWIAQHRSLREPVLGANNPIPNRRPASPVFEQPNIPDVALGYGWVASHSVISQASSNTPRNAPNLRRSTPATI